MFKTFREDVRSVFERDPAAHGWLQVVLCYAGLHAIWSHRIAHALWQRHWKLPAHLIAHTARWLTGIEIHPAARIGARLFIDHGMGVVIGETAAIGADVTLYHGVTLGGVSLTHGKRHPTIEDGVVIGAGAKVLGAITIGRNTRIGANAVVVKDVPPNCVVVGVPGKPVERSPQPSVPSPSEVPRDLMPDVISEQLDKVMARLDRIDERLEWFTAKPSDNVPVEIAEIDYAI